jgi:AcrR family transcriptional regulator
MTLPELSRRERKKEETRRRIFEAAIALFRDKGYEATTVDEITERADVGRGTFFNYFPKKEAVLAYLSEERLAVAEENAGALLAENRPSREKIIDLYLLAADAWVADRELSQYVFGEWLRRVFAPTADVELGWRKLMFALLEQGRASGELRSDVDDTRADAIFTGIYMTTLFHWLFCPEECLPKGFDLRREVRVRLEVVFDGLAPRAKAARP